MNFLHIKQFYRVIFRWAHVFFWLEFDSAMTLLLVQYKSETMDIDNVIRVRIEISNLSRLSQTAGSNN